MCVLCEAREYERGWSGSGASGAVASYVDALDGGYTWSGSAGQSATVKYSFSQSFYDNSPYDTASMNSTEKAAAREALQLWENVANIDFQETTSALTRPDMVLNMAALPEGTAGLTVFIPTGNFLRSVEVMVDTSYRGESFAAGSYAFSTLIHEAGHALGLKHPGAYSSGDDAPYLSFSEDNTDNTVMSYYEGKYSGFAPVTPMIYDIAAAQYLYGANTSYNSGNNVYSFTGANLAETIWDGGGIDEISAGSVTVPVIIDLREGTGYISHIITSHIWNAFGANIEDATGGSAGDAIYGNTLGNTLTGGGGADVIYGHQGADALYGNTGLDTLYGGQDNDSLYGGQEADSIFGNLGNDVLYGNKGADYIHGGGGNDTIYGGQDNDTITGGVGDDLMAGNLGSDRFVFAYGFGSDTIEGFDGNGDALEFSSQLFASAPAALAAVGYSGGNAVMDLGGGGRLVLLSISPGTLDSGDFAVV